MKRQNEKIKTQSIKIENESVQQPATQLATQKQSNLNINRIQIKTLNTCKPILT